jgi:Sec-independent protein secretion pathway component TatC
LGQTRLVSGDQMLSVWRYVVVGAVIAAAILTPSTDPLTQCLLAGPLIGLYMGGAFLVKFLINESEPLEDWKSHTLNAEPPQTVLCNYYCSAGFDDILTSHHTNVG